MSSSLLVTSHSRILIPSYSSLIPAFKPQCSEKEDCLKAHLQSLSLSVHHISETDRLRDMLGANLIGTGKIRNRPCDFNDAVIASG